MPLPECFEQQDLADPVVGCCRYFRLGLEVTTSQPIRLLPFMCRLYLPRLRGRGLGWTCSSISTRRCSILWCAPPSQCSKTPLPFK